VFLELTDNLKINDLNGIDRPCLFRDELNCSF
jgi:hypothetical protein